MSEERIPNRPLRPLSRRIRRIKLGLARLWRSFSQTAWQPIEPLWTRLERWLGNERVHVLQRCLPHAEQERILVPVSNPGSAANLARMAAAIARTRDAQVILLSVQRLRPGRTLEDIKASARASGQQLGLRDQGKLDPDELENALCDLDADRWPALSSAIAAVNDAQTPVGYSILAAENIGLAIRREAQRLDVSVIVLGWRGSSERNLDENRHLAAPLRAVLEYPPADIMVVGGTGEGVPKRLLVPSVRGRNTPVALDLARGLASEGGHVTALKTMRSESRLSEIEAGARRLREDLELFGAAGLGQLVVRATSRSKGILEAIERGYDGVVMAAPQEPILERLLFGRTQLEVAAASQVPVIVVKRRSSAMVYLGRRIWRLAYDRLPKLSLAERKAVEDEIRAASRPRVDFFMMIGLSSAIAGFGLLLNSPAVIIGAMLVAPLMAAIVGVGLGVVEGDLDLIRRAGAAALKGAVLAIVIGALLGLLRLNMNPIPSEILSRTRPGLLDLGVALASGAAGAYAISRRDVSASLAGVAIAAALVPPLVSSGIGLPLGRFDIFFGALFLYITNFVAIAAAGGVTMLLLGFGPAVEEEEERQVFWRWMLRLGGSLLLVGMGLGFLGFQTWRLAAGDRLAQDAESAARRYVATRMQGAEFDSLDISQRPAFIEPDPLDAPAKLLQESSETFESRSTEIGPTSDIEIETPSEPALQAKLREFFGIGIGAETEVPPLAVELTIRTPNPNRAGLHARGLQDEIALEIGQPVGLEMVMIQTHRIDAREVPETESEEE